MLICTGVYFLTAIHDAIAATVRRCRRLIIILSAQVNTSTDGETDEASPLRDNLINLCYEQKVGLYDALTQNDPRVILVEFGECRLQMSFASCIIRTVRVEAHLMLRVFGQCLQKIIRRTATKSHCTGVLIGPHNLSYSVSRL